MEATWEIQSQTTWEASFCRVTKIPRAPHLGDAYCIMGGALLSAQLLCSKRVNENPRCGPVFLVWNYAFQKWFQIKWCWKYGVGSKMPKYRELLPVAQKKYGGFVSRFFFEENFSSRKNCTNGFKKLLPLVIIYVFTIPHWQMGRVHKEVYVNGKQLGRHRVRPLGRQPLK